jgi:hypothetical protein
VIVPTVSSPPKNSSTNDIRINVRRTDVVLRPDPSRVLLRSFTPGAPARLERIITAIMSISEGDVGPMLDAISSKFSVRHRQISNVFRDRFQQLHELVSIDDELSEQRQLLIGSFSYLSSPLSPRPSSIRLWLLTRINETCLLARCALF